MNPVPLFLIIVSLPLLLGGCGGEASINLTELEVREGISYLKGSDAPYTGKVFELHEDGQKKSEADMTNGILNGVIFAIITGLVVQLWFKEFNLSILIAISMILNMIVAGLFGILVPVSLKKFNIDPAIASSVFVTTITDVIGFLSFLGIGAYFFYT